MININTSTPIIGIYKITSPTSKIYIGQSIHIYNRWQHYYRLDCKQQPILYNSLLKHGVEQHVFELIEECSLEQLDEHETYWKQYYIKLKYKVMFCELYDKGGGPRSEETRKKISNALKNHSQYYTEEVKNKISISKKGKRIGVKHTESTKQKMSINRKGKIGKPKTPIIQYDKQGNFIKEWPGIVDAQKIMKLTTIPEHLRGVRKYAGGFIWKYKS